MFMWNPELLEGFMLAFLRVGTAMMLLPVFGYNALPMQLKAGLAFVLAVIMAPAASQALYPAPPGVMAATIAGLSEVTVGLIFGMVAFLILVGAEFAGTIVGMQMGFGIVTVIDPQLGDTSLLGQFQYLFALVLFLALDMHLPMIRALGETFELIPLGGAIYTDKLPLEYARLTGQVFLIAVKFAAPVMAIMFITEMALGVISRVVPQMNVFIVGFPLKIGIGLWGIAVSAPLFAYVAAKVFVICDKDLQAVMILLSGK